MTSYAEKRAALVAALAEGATGVGLAKSTSNLFRDREARRTPRIDLAHFHDVVAVDAGAGSVDAEGMTTFVDLADATLAEGVMPAVVPQLKSITLGGAVAGVGIEATSFRHGLVHENVTRMEVLTGDGRIVTCTPDNEHRDLFRGFPNSYGTLGYALRLTLRTIPVAHHVRVEHRRFAHADAFFTAVADACADPTLDFVDGVVFDRTTHVLSCGRFVATAPYTSDYTFEHIYYRSLLARDEDFLTTRAYLWRWDTDWFWCSRNLGAQQPWIRRLLGRRRLNSIFYQKVMRWNTRWRLGAALERIRGQHAESVIQDVDIPLPRAGEYLAFMHDEIGVLPIWICPIAPARPGARHPLYPLHTDTAYVNFGFWDRVRSRTPRPPGELNRRIERKVAALGGIKSLYSDSYFTEDEFWQVYDRPAYQRLKATYDPAGNLPDLYAKCVLRH